MQCFFCKLHHFGVFGDLCPFSKAITGGTIKEVEQGLDQLCSPALTLARQLWVTDFQIGQHLRQ